ncbi:MAG TPA: HepT-like ribonuclease domain-containing protein [Thermoanaerobaculia bacterium]|nr:HepT-like ribonuclease domain-containing protein [Thermoanaerobaculia bacterium]
MLDILIASEDALTFVRSMTLDDFRASSLVRRAVLHCLMIVGEAAGRVDAAAQAEVPDLPWRRMKDLRNVLIHQYANVNLPVIWTIVTTELPTVVPVLDPLFADRATEEPPAP